MRFHGFVYKESNIRRQTTRPLHRTAASQVTKFMESLLCYKLYSEKRYLFTRFFIVVTPAVDVTLEYHSAIVRSCDCVTSTLT